MSLPAPSGPADKPHAKPRSREAVSADAPSPDLRAFAASRAPTPAPAYPSYKNSDVPWIGQVPAHWEVKPLMTCFKERFVKNTGNVESNVLSLSYGRIVRRDVSTNDGLLPESFETYQIVEVGDTIIRPTDLQNDQTSLRTGLVPERGIITSAYICLEPSANYHHIFAQRVLHAYDIQKVFYNLGGGVRQGIKFDDLKKLPMLLPPFAEQRAIAAWLDGKTGEIDAAVAAQRTLLEQLKEKRRALIAHAVTRGLDPAAPLKDSGVPWLGSVPAHWEVKPLKHIAEYINRGMAPVYVDESPVFVVNQATFSGGELNREKLRYHDAKPKDISRGLLKPRDVLLASTGGGVLGKVAMFNETEGTYMADTHVTTLRFPSDSADSRYYYRFFSTAYDLINGILAEGSTNQTELRRDALREFVLALPPLAEQQAIAAHLDAETAKLDMLTAETEQTIALLQEHRTALIAEAVTGKIRVPGVAV